MFFLIHAIYEVSKSQYFFRGRETYNCQLLKVCADFVLK